MNAQDQKKMGYLVIEKHTFVANKHLKPSESEIEAEKGKLRQFVEKEINSENPEDFINSMPKSELEHNTNDIKCLYVLDIYANFYESTASCDYTKPSNIFRYRQINRQTLDANEVIRNVKKNKYKIGQKFKNRELFISNDFEIIENRNKTKNIEGFHCFQVNLRRKTINNSHLPVYDFEMYVTEEIKLNYNPVWNYKDILEKYYPLEIIKKSREAIMTEITTWKIKSIDLKNE
ncbi:hypothetical protein H2O64_04530 [Kordia sp. YSTF-M3]|uniref:Uncharacterized protein n=1 Tax=Kordia aestuariivivens TaxID=2759037 RepID=A0ABR7Q5T7_9FLAO|nr:hypothetical protein [Kordia aestuariivivens]MBC8753924.1 hypothetical protein [Kordia aestuariivivens]